MWWKQVCGRLAWILQELLSSSTPCSYGKLSAVVHTVVTRVLNRLNCVWFYSILPMMTPGLYMRNPELYMRHLKEYIYEGHLNKSFDEPTDSLWTSNNLSYCNYLIIILTANTLITIFYLFKNKSNVMINNATISAALLTLHNLIQPNNLRYGDVMLVENYHFFYATFTIPVRYFITLVVPFIIPYRHVIIIPVHLVAPFIIPYRHVIKYNYPCTLCTRTNLEILKSFHPIRPVARMIFIFL